MKDDMTVIKVLMEGAMKNLLQWIEANLGKLIGIPFSVSSIQFVLMLIHAMSDGVIDHNEFEALQQAGNGSSMIMLALALAYLKFKKNKDQ